jgi:hypothetical protein
MIMVDVPPLQSHSLAEYKKTWNLFFVYHLSRGVRGDHAGSADTTRLIGGNVRSTNS